MSKKLGNQVKKARTDKGLTQAELAKKVKGLTASDISKIEQGEKEPTQAVLKEMAKALDVTQTSLISAASGKTRTTAAKKTASKTTAAKKTTAKKTASKTSSDLKLTAAEKKLVQLYRKADADVKKTVVSMLDGSVSVVDLLKAMILAKTGGSSGSSSGSASGSGSSVLENLLGSLLGGKTEEPAEKTEGSALSSLLENLLGNQKR